MATRKHTAEEIINKLREAEVVISTGSTVAEASRRIGVSEQTFYRWRTEYGGLRIDQVRAVAELTLDDQILKEVAEGNSGGAGLQGAGAVPLDRAPRARGPR